MGVARIERATPDTAVRSRERLGRRAAVFLRARIAAVATETTTEIFERVPEYARPRDPVYAQTVSLAVEQGLRHFADILDGRGRRGGRPDGWRQVYRAIGAGELREGRSLDAVHAAIRVGGRVGHRMLLAFAEAEALSTMAIAGLAETMWVYLDDLAEASNEGYLQARAAEIGELDRRRMRLLSLLLADPPAGDQALRAAAEAARWPLPRRLAVVAIEWGTARRPPMLAPEVLGGLDRSEPCLVIPDPDSPARVRSMVASLAGRPAAVGPPVPPAEAANSLRWARMALTLARRAVIASDGLLWCTDHLGTLAVFQDEALLGSLVDRRLAPLAQLRESQRDVLADTLLAWLQLGMNASAVATRLHVHPQTVRHRLRQLDLLFGAQTADPEARFELEIALRADHAGRAERAVRNADRD
jgi:PucR C-terminal helix-turn-helix domain